MDPQNQQTSPMQPISNSVMPEHKKVGPIIAILVIVLILIIGALYLFASKINKQSDMTNTTAESQTQQSVIPVTSTSDDVGDLQADLNAATQGLDSQNF